MTSTLLLQLIAIILLSSFLILYIAGVPIFLHWRYCKKGFCPLCYGRKLVWNLEFRPLRFELSTCLRCNGSGLRKSRKTTLTKCVNCKGAGYYDDQNYEGDVDV